MTPIFVNLKQTVSDLNRRWGYFGTFVIVALFIIGLVANVVQVGSVFPLTETLTVPIPLTLLLFLIILVVSALASLVLQLRSSELTIKRVGATQLTDIYVYQGELYFGTKRNVLLRLETIQSILQTIFATQADEARSNQHLHDLGQHIGKSFAAGFIDQVDKKGLLKGEKKLKEMIDIWCEYDVEAGWGKFIYQPTNDAGTRGEIAVRSNFLTASVDDNGPLSQSVCSFMAGYIAGVLEIFARIVDPIKNWKSEVRERRCGIKQHGHESCVFEFDVREMKQNS